MTKACQKCGRTIITKEEFKIILGKEPICNICNFKIQLSSEEINRILLEVGELVTEKIKEDINYE